MMITDRPRVTLPSSEPGASSVHPRPRRTFIKRHPVLAYYVLAFVISWGGILLVIVGGRSAVPATQEQFDRLMPFAIPFMLFGPGIAGIVMTGLADGKAGYRQLIARLLRWQVGAGWYAIALLTAPLVFTAVALALSLSSPEYLPGILRTSDKAGFLLVGTVPALLVGVLEELSWTGFAMPRLRLCHGLLTTGLTMGLLWGAWHLLTNDLWAAGTISGELPVGPFVTVYGLSLLLTQLLVARVLMVWVYEHTGSLLLLMLMHASYAFSTFVLQPLQMAQVPLLIFSVTTAAVMWMVVAAIAAVNGGHLARRQSKNTRA
jgi:membrane protease YdiL (CAAX protease family)